MHLNATNTPIKIVYQPLRGTRRLAYVFKLTTRLACAELLITAGGLWRAPLGGHRPSVVLAAGPDGQSIFKDHCAGCHGADGKGISTVSTPDFTDPKIQASLTDKEIIDTITNGREGTIMPAWKGQLSEQEISTVAAFVRSLGQAGDRN